MEEIERTGKVNVALAAKLTCSSLQYIREGLKQQRLPYGEAVLMPSGRWCYHIYPKKFYAYLDKIGEEEENHERQA